MNQVCEQESDHLFQAKYPEVFDVLDRGGDGKCTFHSLTLLLIMLYSYGQGA